MLSYSSKFNQILRLMVFILAIGALLTAATGCSWSKKKKSFETANPSVLSDAPASVPGGDGTAAATGDPMHGSFGEPVPFPAGAMETVFFDFDQAAPRRDQGQSLAKDAKYLKDHPEDKVYIEGHCDERGTVEYNLSLGQRRAAAIQDYFTSHGISADRIVTASKGEEEPADPAHSERAFAKNRRCEFKQVK